MQNTCLVDRLLPISDTAYFMTLRVLLVPFKILLYKKNHLFHIYQSTEMFSDSANFRQAECETKLIYNRLRVRLSL